jgi:hypothetical protein
MYSILADFNWLGLTGRPRLGRPGQGVEVARILSLKEPARKMHVANPKIIKIKPSTQGQTHKQTKPSLRPFPVSL